MEMNELKQWLDRERIEINSHEISLTSLLKLCEVQSDKLTEKKRNYESKLRAFNLKQMMSEMSHKYFYDDKRRRYIATLEQNSKTSEYINVIYVRPNNENHGVIATDALHIDTVKDMREISPAEYMGSFNLAVESLRNVIEQKIV